jgi:hypothetical protein
MSAMGIKDTKSVKKEKGKDARDDAAKLPIVQRPKPAKQDTKQDAPQRLERLG